MRGKEHKQPQNQAKPTKQKPEPKTKMPSRARGPPHLIFFHEYGRRVGMVPRSSLKGGKNSLMVEKRTRKPNNTQNKQPPQPRAHRPCLHHHVVFPLCKVKHVRRERVSRKGPELTKEKHIGGFVLKQSCKKASKGLHFTFMSDQRPHSMEVLLI